MWGLFVVGFILAQLPMTQDTYTPSPAAAASSCHSGLVLSYANAFPAAAFPQHSASQTTTVQNYRCPGAAQPKITVTVLSYTNGYPGAAFSQHSASQTTTVQNYLYQGGVSP